LTLETSPSGEPLTAGQAREAALVSRLTTDYVLRSLETMAGLFEGDYLLAIVYLALTKATLADRAGARAVNVSESGVVPDSMRRPVTVSSVAASLSLPRETTRRYVNRLVELGVCERLPDRRLIVTQAILMRQAFREAAVRNYRDVARLNGDLRRLAPLLPEI